MRLASTVGLGLALLLAAGPAVCQSGRGSRRSSAAHSQNADESTSKQAMPDFTGVVRGVDSKILLLEQADQNTMQFYSTKKTQYFDGEKKIKVSQIKAGDRVSVEARLGPDGKPEAVNIWLQPKEASQGTDAPR